LASLRCFEEEDNNCVVTSGFAPKAAQASAPGAALRKECRPEADFFLLLVPVLLLAKPVQLSKHSPPAGSSKPVIQFCKHAGLQDRIAAELLSIA
jgi:hypothetical protein